MVARDNASPTQLAQLSRAALLLLVLLVAGVSPTPAEQQRTLRGGWYQWDPYQYISADFGVSQLTGLDVRLTRAICAGAGLGVEITEVSWVDHLAQIESGERDIAAGAFATEARSRYAWFSEPYRSEVDVLLMRKGESSRLRAGTVEALLAELAARKLRVAVVAGYHYGPEVMAWKLEERNRRLVVETGSDAESLEKLLLGRVDAMAVDRLAGATLAWRRGLQGRIERHPVPLFVAELRFMFSKRTVTPGEVAAFNASLKRLQDSGGYDEVVREYLFPVLLAITLHQPWFLAIGLIGTVAFAISGLLLARKERYDIFGAFVLAALPSVGGGVLRDLLTDRNPLDVMQDPRYLVIVIVVVVIGTVFYKARDWAVARRLLGEGRTPHRLPGRLGWNLVQAFDALGLAAFTVVGVVVAIEARCHPLWLWGPLLAVLTGAGGGILRDIVRADSHNPYLKGSIYPEIALVWGLVFSAFLVWETPRLHLHEVLAGVIATMAGSLLTRFVVLRYNLQSLFLYDFRRHSPKAALAQAEVIQTGWLATLPSLLDGVRDDTRPEQGFDLEAHYNRCAALGSDSQARLTRLAAERLPEESAELHSILQTRQWRLAALQTDLRELARRLGREGHAGSTATLETAFAEAVDALLHCTIDAFTSRAQADAAVLLQATSGQGTTLASVRERYASSLAAVTREERREVLHLVGLFERIVGHLRALGTTLPA